MTTSSLWRRTPLELGLMGVVFVFMLLMVFALLPEAPPDLVTNFCPQQPAINATTNNFLDEYEFSPSTHYNYVSSQQFYTPEYTDYSLDALQGAIRIPTVSYDDMAMDPKKEPRFEIFAKFHDYLFKKFPLAAKHVETVNEYGLLYTFEGKDSDLKPVVLMAHQDVVPVPDETLDQWTHPPFEAYYDGEYLTGRGSADTKDTLVGLLEAAEALLSQNWKPQRTVIFSFGFDEEIGGARGASPLAQTLFERYGSDGIEMVVDEGLGMPNYYGALAGIVGVTERGYADIWISLTTPGGHSSAPPDHTGIGIISQVIKLLELHPYAFELDDVNPTLGFFQCLAEHAPSMNSELRRTALDLYHVGHREKLVEAISADAFTKNMIRTTQAVDVIHGGVKLNALPEEVLVKVNHRININSSPAGILDRVENIVLSLARQFDLGVFSDGETLVPATTNGYFNLTMPRRLEPAPISPSTGLQWELLTGTARAVFEQAPFAMPKLVIAPYCMTANTDTRYYWSLTRAIYRFKPTLGIDSLNIHTVDERLGFRSHLLTVAFFYDFILNTST